MRRAAWIGAGAIALVAAGLPAYALHRYDLAPAPLLAWSAAALLTLFAAHAASPFVAPHVSRLYRKDKVLIVGINDVARRLSRLIASGEADGQQLVGFVEDRSPPRLR